MAEIWGVAIAGVVAAGASYASAKSAQGAAKGAAKAEIEAEKEKLRMQRQYQLEDRKYNQDAVGAWSKYLDPALVGGTTQVQTASDPASTANAASTQSNDEGKAIDDPNDPRFKPNPLAPAANALPINHPAMFQGMRPQNGQVPQSLWFARQFPDYDPNNPTGA